MPRRRGEKRKSRPWTAIEEGVFEVRGPASLVERWRASDSASGERFEEQQDIVVSEVIRLMSERPHSYHLVTPGYSLSAATDERWLFYRRVQRLLMLHNVKARKKFGTSIWRTMKARTPWEQWEPGRWVLHGVVLHPSPQGPLILHWKTLHDIHQAIEKARDFPVTSQDAANILDGGISVEENGEPASGCRTPTLRKNPNEEKEKELERES